MQKNASLIKAGAIIVQTLPSLIKLLVDQELLENVEQQLINKPGLINPELSRYFLRHIVPAIFSTRDEIRSQLEK